jgi:hypothetical protein
MASLGAADRCPALAGELAGGLGSGARPDHGHGSDYPRWGTAPPAAPVTLQAMSFGHTLPAGRGKASIRVPDEFVTADYFTP